MVIGNRAQSNTRILLNRQDRLSRQAFLLVAVSLVLPLLVALVLPSSRAYLPMIAVILPFLTMSKLESIRAGRAG